MKVITAILFLIIIGVKVKAQENNAIEKYGKTLNIGVGVGYYGHLGQPLPVGNINFEFDLFKNFTLAPFIGLYSYRRNYYWGDKNNPSRYYSNNTLVIPMGVKGTYYFDQLFKATQKWDFYVAGSVGFSYQNTVWENGYYGDVKMGSYASPLYLDAHAGAEYHLTTKTGLFLDLSTGVSTVGLAFHF